MDFNLAFKGLKSGFDKEAVYDVIVIGAGPAGLSAALYAKRKGLLVGVICGKVGGQVMDTTSVENYLGIEMETGEGLSNRFLKHVETLKVPILKDAKVLQMIKVGPHFKSILEDGSEVKSKTVIVATGSKPRRLGIPGEEEYAGKGVAYCAICDGPLFEGMDVVVAGGGNSAVEAALDLSKIAKTVKLVHRSVLRADQIVVEQLMKQENVTVHLETQIESIVGDQLLGGICVLDKKTGKQSTMEASGLFVEIGYLPNNQVAQGLLTLNHKGEIVINALNETSVPGIFAAGDVTDTPYKQIVVAASEGAKAALSANDFINRKG